MKNHTLAEIKEELNRRIEKLENLDPFWKKCRHCPNHGKCCIDNDIDIREDEWNQIQKVLDSNASIREQVYDNLIHGRKCYFRTASCCLIHGIRPTNCIYTPYQAVISEYENHLIYNSVDEDCNFKRMETEADPYLINQDILEIKGEPHPYLLLNPWVKDYENQSVDCYKMLGEERLREYFHLDGKSSS